MQRSLSPKVNPYAKGLLEILNKGNLVEEAAPGFPVDEKIDIASLCGFPPRHRAEHSHIPRAV